MSEGPVPVDDGLDALESKVQRTVELVRHLREERRRLLEVNAGLEAQLAAAGSAGRDGQVAELTGRLAHLEKERAQWLTEKRAVTRRVEDILAKLEFLESESAPR